MGRTHSYNRRKVKSGGKTRKRKIRCPFCGNFNEFKVRIFPKNDPELHKIHKHCARCGAECHFTNYGGVYWHPVNKKEKQEEDKQLLNHFYAN